MQCSSCGIDLHKCDFFFTEEKLCPSCKVVQLQKQVEDLNAIIKDKDPTWDGRLMTKREADAAEMALQIINQDTEIDRLQKQVKGLKDQVKELQTEILRLATKPEEPPITSYS